MYKIYLFSSLYVINGSDWGPVMGEASDFLMYMAASQTEF